jgi:hypothetical protein
MVHPPDVLANVFDQDLNFLLNSEPDIKKQKGSLPSWWYPLTCSSEMQSLYGGEFSNPWVFLCWMSTELYRLEGHLQAKILPPSGENTQFSYFPLWVRVDIPKKLCKGGKSHGKI